MTTVHRVTPEELQRRNASALDLHQPLRQSRNRAAPRCAECGFPHPCEARRRLEGKS